MPDITLGDRMKLYEHQNDKELIPLLPVCIRLDGRAFHSFCHGLQRPYDERLSNIMRQLTKWLVEETNACIGYGQSDEISLILYSDSLESQIFFDGNHQKIISVLAAMCSVKFNQLVAEQLVEKKDKLAVFDCRAWNVPTRQEAINNLIWRERDATRNSISMSAQANYSHNQLQNKNSDEMQEMLFQKGINWNDYPVFFKRGSYFQRKKILRKFTIDEIEKLPAKHEARTNPELVIERTQVCEIEMPILTTAVNQINVIFYGSEPIVNSLGK